MCSNHKRIYRLYGEAGLAVKRWSTRVGLAVERETVELPITTNQVWRMEFVGDALASGRRIEILTIIDEFAGKTLDQ